MAYNSYRKISTRSNISTLDSKSLTEPIIDKNMFLNSIKKIIGYSFDVSLLEYKILKDSIDVLGSFSEKHRFTFWKYLLSLPNNIVCFEYYNSKGIHSFFRDYDFELKDQFKIKRMRQICSLVAHWSEHIGNVFYLPHIIFPLMKIIKGDDVFLFELIITIITSYGQYWFEFYPGAPVSHLELLMNILERESFKLITHIKKLEREYDLVSLKLYEIIWRLIRTLFSESLINDNYLQLLDFIFTYSFKPEYFMYFACSFILHKETSILKCKNISDIDKCLYTNNKYDMPKLFKNTHKLYNKYNKLQYFTYTPYVPFPIDEYPMIDKFPLDFIQTTNRMRNELAEEENIITTRDKINDLDDFERKIIEMSRLEESVQNCYTKYIYKAKDKASKYTKDLDSIFYNS
jgi:hypothetical protein